MNSSNRSACGVFLAAILAIAAQAHGQSINGSLDMSGRYQSQVLPADKGTFRSVLSITNNKVTGTIHAVGDSTIDSAGGGLAPAVIGSSWEIVSGDVQFVKDPSGSQGGSQTYMSLSLKELLDAGSGSDRTPRTPQVNLTWTPASGGGNLYVAEGLAAFPEGQSSGPYSLTASGQFTPR